MRKIIEYLQQDKPITWGELIGLYFFSSIIISFIALMTKVCV